MDVRDTYKTIEIPSEEVLYKDKNSKFFGYAFPINNEQDVKIHLNQLKKQHHSARHWCYGYQLGTSEDNRVHRFNDDGEPNNSAGAPIFGQIQSYDVTNVLIVVVRYFGGVKLGVSGLINAYRSAAKLALEQALIIEKTITLDYVLTFAYKDMNRVMRIIKEKRINIVKQELAMDCKIHISARLSQADEIFSTFQKLYEIDIKSIP